jgi:hypothetical protein
MFFLQQHMLLRFLIHELVFCSFCFWLQETALNHVKGAGLLGDGFGSTPEMCKKNLIWVVTRMQVVVDRYPTW